MIHSEDFFLIDPPKIKKKWFDQNNEKWFMIIVNHTTWVLQKIPSECLWCERWPVWGYVGVESAQSSFPLICRKFFAHFADILSWLLLFVVLMIIPEQHVTLKPQGPT